MISFGGAVQEDIATVLLSILIAVLATYSALDLAGRVRGAVDRVSAHLWVAAGAVALGSGIWAMHFVGLSAAELPFATRYRSFGSVLSWLAAVGVSGFVLGVAGRADLRWTTVVILAVFGGLGATLMHGIGMNALVVAPAMDVNYGWVAAAAITAVLGCGASMGIYAVLRETAGWRRIAGQMATALLFGGSLSAMHYLNMMAVSFAPGTICTTLTGGLNVEELGHPLGAAAVVFMVLTMLTTALERRATRRAAQLDGSLAKTLQELEYVSFSDLTTGLPNRSVFQDRLGQAAQRSRRSGLSFAVLCIEIDGFEAVLEHADDAQIKQTMRWVAGKLGTALRASDTLASGGQHRFLAIMEDLADAEPARRAAESMISMIGEQAPSSGDASPLSLSMGIVMFPSDGPEARCVGNAAATMALAQRQGGSRYVFFQSYLDSAARAQCEWIRDLKLALQHRQFELHYQPKVFCESGLLAGAEALLRWTHPTRGSVSPAVFVPMAEKAGLMGEIGDWVLQEACRQMGLWQREGRPQRVAVNLSAHQLREEDLPDRILSAMQRFGVDSKWLTCEVTETAAMENTEVTTAVLDRLRHLGIRLSIDDFGTGFSSLSYLRRLPVSQLKIDRSFVNDLAHSVDAQAIVRGIIDLAHALRLEVVAEGVETREQRAILQSLGCDKLQGYLFARPLDCGAFEAWAQENQERAMLAFEDTAL